MPENDDLNDDLNQVLDELWAERAAFIESDGTDEERLALLDTSVRHHEALLDALADEAPEAIELHEGLGFLCQQRALLTDEGEDLLLSARHYAAVLDAAHPDSDLPLVRHSRAVSLMLHGRATRTRAELRRRAPSSTRRSSRRGGPAVSGRRGRRTPRTNWSCAGR